jgi:predicted phosphodiesterase
MRYAIISDIHANLAAFMAVLDDIEYRGGVEKVWCLGDTVGYGPDPHECIELLQRTNHICVAGNHDWAAIDKIGISEFNPDAAATSQWTTKQLNPRDKKYLGSLPLVIEEDNFTLVHGSPREPTWEYITSISIAKQNFAYFKSQFCLAGHSHVPLVFSYNDSGTCSYCQFQPNVGLTPGKNRLIVNPGSVGQPRDGNAQASYAIYDSEIRMVRLYRIPYDIHITQDKMVKLGLPLRLVTRLSYGI